MKIFFDNTSFRANYVVNGKQTPKETNSLYKEKIKMLEKNRRLAVQAQEYLQTPIMQEAISSLPHDSFVRLNTGVLDRGNAKEDEILEYTPFISFETRTINEQIALNKNLGKNVGMLDLSLDETGNLNKNQINDWFTSIMNYFS